ncbi:carboxylate-amine ligase [Kitasatospora camelliae]|uniref:Putative glutamate--cysteine ligase 2 n=1 Tax=Kitasatospora camelliae TaxID=3156397 RepID=A0AAU8JSY2_9ACTN
MSTPAGRLRFGVEEEYLLADPETRTTVPRAAAVVECAAQTLGARAQFEFLATQVEACTPPVETAGDLRAELVAMRRATLGAASGVGCLLVASGTAVLPSRHPLPVTGSLRYRRMAEDAGPVADRAGELCGCHVHLGDLDRGEALALAGHLRPWLPVLQAVCVNSPFCEGRSNGVASSRWSRHLAWPTCGPAPLLDERGYERTVCRLLADRVIRDRRMIYWYTRPSEHLPTLEIRVADTNADLDVPVLLAVLLRGLAEVLLAEHRTGAVPPPLSAGAVREAHRRAAEVGLNGDGLDPVTGRRVPARLRLEALLDRAAPGLELHDDLLLARSLVDKLLTRGTGAERQRVALARHGSLPAVVDHLARLTARLTSTRTVVTLPAL